MENYHGSVDDIKKAILKTPTHKVKIKTPSNIDGDLDTAIETIEIDMFLFRLLGSDYKKIIKIN